MKLREFAGILPVDTAAGAGLDVAAITSNSREVAAGSLFFGVPGSKSDGAAYAADAARRGAVAVVVNEAASTEKLDAAVLRVPDSRRALALSAARFYGRQPATMVAVTGTSGKTSVASFVRQIWEHAGHAAASIGTTGVTAPGRNDYGTLTTPDPVALHKLLQELANSGVTHAAMEASSHGLDQPR